MARKGKVTMVNPSPRKKRKKPMAKRKKRAAPKRARRRRRKSNPTRRTSSRRRSSTRRSSSRRRNPVSRYTKLNVREGFDGVLWRAVGMMIATFVVQRWGVPATQPMGQTPQSGQVWSARNYFIALLGGYISAEMIAKFHNVNDAKQVWRGVCDLVVFKLIWGQLFARNAYTQWAFGGMANNIQTDASGTVWLMQPDGSAVSMQGYMGAPQEATSLGAVVEESSLGAVVEESSLGFYDPDVPEDVAVWNAYNDSGGDDRYSAAYASV